MKKGFAYLSVLVLLAVLLSAVGYFSISARRWQQIAAADFTILQARQMAESATVYAEAQGALPLVRNNVSAPNRDRLLLLEGFDYIEEDMGFRIVQNRDTIYFIGYAGALSEPRAVKILYTTAGGNPRPWYD